TPAIHTLSLHDALPISMRMGIALIRRAMRRPAGMADPGLAADRITHQQIRQCDQLADRAAPIQPALMQRGDAGAVIAAVFQPLQRFQDQGCDLVTAEDADNPAHPPFAFAVFSARSRSIILAPNPSRTCGRARATINASAGTSRVTTVPAPTTARAPIATGATSALFEPMKAPAPISVWCLKTPS